MSLSVMDLVEEIWEKSEEEEDDKEISLEGEWPSKPSFFSSCPSLASSSSSPTIAVTRCGFDLITPSSSFLPSSSLSVSSSYLDGDLSPTPQVRPLESQETAHKRRKNNVPSSSSPLSVQTRLVAGQEGGGRGKDRSTIGREEEREELPTLFPSPLHQDGSSLPLDVAAVCGGMHALRGLAEALKRILDNGEGKKRRKKTGRAKKKTEENREAAGGEGEEHGSSRTTGDGVCMTKIDCLSKITRVFPSYHIQDEDLRRSPLLYRQGFHSVYLLRSLRSSKYTYIGYSVDPIHRLRQHNGDIPQGGAWKTKKNRPWCLVLVVHGFLTSIAALQFEWRWQRAIAAIDFLGKKPSTSSSLSRRKKLGNKSIHDKLSPAPAIDDGSKRGSASKKKGDLSRSSFVSDRSLKGTYDDPSFERREGFERKRSNNVLLRDEEEKQNKGDLESVGSLSSSHPSGLSFISSPSPSQVYIHPRDSNENRPGERGEKYDRREDEEDVEGQEQKKIRRRRKQHLFFSQLEEQKKARNIPLGGLRGHGSKQNEDAVPRYKMTRTGGICVRSGQRLRALLVLLQSPPFSRMPLAVHVVDSIVGTPFFRSISMRENSELIYSATSSLSLLTSTREGSSSSISACIHHLSEDRRRRRERRGSEEEGWREAVCTRKEEGRERERTGRYSSSSFLLPPHVPVSYGDASLLLPLIKAGNALAKEAEKERGWTGGRRRRRNREREEEDRLSGRGINGCIGGIDRKSPEELGREISGPVGEHERVMSENRQESKRKRGEEEKEEERETEDMTEDDKVVTSLNLQVPANAYKGREEGKNREERTPESSSSSSHLIDGRENTSSFFSSSFSATPSSSSSFSFSPRRSSRSHSCLSTHENEKRNTLCLSSARREDEKNDVEEERRPSERRKIRECRCLVCKTRFSPGDLATQCPACEALAHILCIARTSIHSSYIGNHERDLHLSLRRKDSPLSSPSVSSSSSCTDLNERSGVCLQRIKNSGDEGVRAVGNEASGKERERKSSNGFSLVPDQIACVRCKRVILWGEVLALSIRFHPLSPRGDMNEDGETILSSCFPLPRSCEETVKENEVKRTFARDSSEEMKKKKSESKSDERKRRRDEEEEGGQESTRSFSFLSPSTCQSLHTPRSVSRWRSDEKEERENICLWIDDHEEENKRKSDEEEEEVEGGHVAFGMETRIHRRERDKERREKEKSRDLLREEDTAKKTNVIIDLSCH
ncbi:giy-yig catalytic domain-containing protein [Cystoisospora suis]|uniref:Giy-yig catalytic domain-containing protein n=1 Tax=Cystoisospora suis TaxID=483139 RepID=A0A2C6JA49_9APIC|nr:giy-yig catalytic domain-containing protein [Cystoisospora suis]